MIGTTWGLISDFFLFRLCTIVGVMGTSMLAFVIPTLAMSKLARAGVNHMCAGFALGLSMIALPLEASHYLASNFVFVLLLQATAFVVVVILEQLALTSCSLLFSSYSYTALSVSDETECEGIEIQDQIYDPKKVAREENPTQCGEAISCQHSPLVRLSPSSFLVVTSVYAFADALAAGSNQHETYGNLIRMFIHKIILSFIFGDSLKHLNSPKSYFLYSFGVFTAASPLGLLVSCFVVPSWSSMTTRFYGCCAAICSGFILHLASTQIFPAEMAQPLVDVNASLLKICGLVFGFVAVAMPAVFLEYK